MLFASKISPRARALIDRLARMDQTQPRLDKVAIERAIAAHFKALGLRQRPIVWVEDARSGFRRVADQIRAGGLASAMLNLIDQMWCWARFLLVSAGLGLGAFALIAPVGLLAEWLLGAPALRNHLGAPTFIGVIGAAALIGASYLALILVFARNLSRRRAVARPIEAALLMRQELWDEAVRAVAGDAVLGIFTVDFWRHVWIGAAFAAHDQALSEVYGRLWNTPPAAKLAR